ncbi:MAG TPA: DUF6615 family protein [Acidobacteriota bacterium]|nr:DUF6615 family protein [Acidobacteriota bacterium]
MSDCEALQESSRFVRDWFRRQPAVKEESLTDWLLFDISQKIPRVTYRAFSHHEEARQTGADWEWWFLFSSFAFKMRVQAKKLKPSEDHYPGIAHTNQHGLQIEKLLHDAHQTNSMPFYAFYTVETAEVMCRMGRNDEGVFMAEGHRIHGDVIAVPRRRIDSSDVLKHTIALSCFLCCPLALGKVAEPGLDPGDRGYAWSRFMREYFGSGLTQSLSDGEDLDSTIPGVHRQIPSYVRSFVEAGEEGVPDWWEKEFHHDIEGIGALVVYDGRERPE